jgi:hypothetical protein
MNFIKITKVLPAFLLVGLAFSPGLSAQGHFEFGFHYSTWSIDLLGNVIENAVSDALETDLKEVILEDIQDDYDYLRERSYTQSVEFDSSGHNYGFEMRWYPGGENGSFSLGLSVEKTKMTVELPEVAAALDFTDNSEFQGSANGKFLISPLSFHLSFRWDILPASVVHPYITFGVGAAAFSSIESGEVSYAYSGELDRTGFPLETRSGGETKTIKELQDELEEEEEDFLPLPFLPFIQLNLGLKGRVTENIYLLVDAGIWNGLILRGGVAVRL